MPTPFEILGLEPDASNEDIQTAFDQLKTECYANLRNPETHAEYIEKIKQITQARETLLNATLRAKYEAELNMKDEIKKSVPSPWRRFFARYFDQLIFFALYYLAYQYCANYVFFENWQLAVEAAVIGIVLYILLETAIVSILGTTLGKWILSMKITTADGHRPKFLQSAKRNFIVALLGFALFIPPFFIVTMLIQYLKLKKPENNILTSWDRTCGTVINYGEMHAYRLLIILPFLVMVCVYLVKAIK
jgi:uncharacterized RDD family membrane protein YckC